MPRNFPDMDSLKRAAECHGFRKPLDDELEAEFRTALADHAQDHDLVESEEIRNGVGWNRFNDQQNLDMVRRQLARRK